MSLSIALKIGSTKLLYLLKLQAASLHERSKRDASDANSSSDSSSSSDGSSSSSSGNVSDDSDSDGRDSSTTESNRSTTEGDSGTTESTTATLMGDCALLGDYIDFELSNIPDRELFVGSFPDFSSFVILSINETAPTFLELLESTPSLFANISQAIDDGFFDETLAADFVAVATDSCGISLSAGQITNITRLFSDQILLNFFDASQSCDALNQTRVEAAIAVGAAAAAAAVSSNGLFDLGREFLLEPIASFLFRRVNTGVSRVLIPQNDDDSQTVAQAVQSEFLFIITDFCDIPLSNVTLALVDDYYESVLAFALRP